MMTLYGYWRSSASYRVRIALALKGVEVNHVTVNLRDSEQSDIVHMSRSAQGYVPVLELENGTQLTQSLAIMDYIDASFDGLDLMPSDAAQRSKILAASLIIASDIHPIQNLSVLKYLRAEYGQGDAGVASWVRHWIEKGFTALEADAAQYDSEFFMTDGPTFFECCLVPQVYNANRFGVDMGTFPKLQAINAACLALPQFQKAVPENQHDAVR